MSQGRYILIVLASILGDLLRSLAILAMTNLERLFPKWKQPYVEESKNGNMEGCKEMKKVTDLTEYRLKCRFVEAVNSHIMIYNAVHPDLRYHHSSAIGSHQSTAWLLGWPDIAELIDAPYKAIINEKKPTPITFPQGASYDSTRLASDKPNGRG